MKKSLYLSVCTLILFALGVSQVEAQKFGQLDKSPLDISAYPASHRVADKVVKVVYSRPYKKDRVTFGNLAPYGKVWRTGANESAEITFYQDVKLGGKEVAAGTYSLFTLPEEDKWTIILNENLNQWGAYSYDEGADVLRVDAPVKKLGESLENFSISFDKADNGATMYMGWDQTYVAVPVEFEEDASAEN